MKQYYLLILMFNIFCAVSKILHETDYVVACFKNGTTEIQLEYNNEEILYIDLERHEVVYTVPRNLMNDPSEAFEGLNLYKNALKQKKMCLALLAFFSAEEKHPPEEKDPPESVLYPAEEAQLGVENILTCFVNHFYPPNIKISWTKNGRPVSEEVSLSRYYPNNDQTFHQFSTLAFTPREGDIYSCTVQHPALDRPITRIWEPELNQSNLGPDVFCGVGLMLGILGIAAGAFLVAKGQQGRIISLNQRDDTPNMNDDRNARVFNRNNYMLQQTLS